MANNPLIYPETYGEYAKTAVEFIPRYERIRLSQPMDLIGEFDNGTAHMNHYRFDYHGCYLDCRASTENRLIEIGKQRVTEKLHYSEKNFAEATALCNKLNEDYFAAKVICHPDYDKMVIYFDVWFQSLVPQTPDLDMDYLVEGTLILADVVVEEVDKLIELLKSSN